MCLNCFVSLQRKVNIKCESVKSSLLNEGLICSELVKHPDLQVITLLAILQAHNSIE